MKSRNNTTTKHRQWRTVMAVIGILALPLVTRLSQAKEVVLFNLTSSASQPEAELIADSNGVLYGTAASGGSAKDGAVFSLTPPPKGQTNWTETVLYNFLGGSDGAFPTGALTPDGSGGFFSTTAYGGGGPCNFAPAQAGCGTVFHLTPGPTNWTETVLYSFQGTDGSQPFDRLTLDNLTGVLYGTTYSGGSFNAGTVFALTPPPLGQTTWTESVLYSFTGGADGGFSFGYLAEDANGNLYGTTTAGGATGNGTVFELTPPSGGKTNWAETVLYSFNGWAACDGGYPSVGLIFDGSGNLYSTTDAGGCLNYGTVFELSPPSGGKTTWTENTLYMFGGEKDGALATSDIIMDRNGAIYGTTAAGGASNNGIVFKLIPPPQGQTAWTEKRLVTFNGADGSYGFSGLTPVKVGKKVALFGDTFEGGSSGIGVVFEINNGGFAP